MTNIVVKRYLQWCAATHRHQMSEHENGQWVTWDDYLQLSNELSMAEEGLANALQEIKILREVIDSRDRALGFVPLDEVEPGGSKARPLSEWHEDDGPVIWWKFPVEEPAWIGGPNDSDWPGYHTHWTPHPPAPVQKRRDPIICDRCGRDIAGLMVHECDGIL